MAVTPFDTSCKLIFEYETLSSVGVGVVEQTSVLAVGARERAPEAMPLELEVKPPGVVLTSVIDSR